MPGKTAIQHSDPTSTRPKIVAGARRHFLAEGFRTVTMDDLADELGMSKKTLYAHFPSKTELVRAVMIEKLDQAEAELEAISSRFQADFELSLHNLLACMKKHGDEIRPPFLRDVRRDTPELFSIVEERRTAMIHKHFERLFKAGRKAGMIRKDLALPLIIEMLVAATQAIVNPQKIDELGLTPKSAFSAIISVVLEGTFTELGKGKL